MAIESSHGLLIHSVLCLTLSTSINMFTGDALGLTPAANCSLAIKALGGCVSYLGDCFLDIQVLSMSQFTSHSLPDGSQAISQQDKNVNKWKGGNTMVLDAITLRNLRIVQVEGCLYDKLNVCSTNMGKRLVKLVMLLLLLVLVLLFSQCLKF